MNDQRSKIILTALLLFIVVFTAADIVEDLEETVTWSHLAIEFSVLVSSLGAAAWIWLDRRVLARQTRDLATRLEITNSNAEHWRGAAQQYLRGLGVAIEEQFATWRLTGAERDVGLLILKGLSLKEIADIRGKSERTVRQQARELYRKSDLSGRAEFAAFFLEDLLLPTSASDSPPDYLASGAKPAPLPGTPTPALQLN